MFDAGRENSGCGYEEMLLDFVYGELSDDDRLKFEGHMSNCSGCLEETKGLGVVSSQIREWKSAEFDQSVLPNIASAVAAERIAEESRTPRNVGLLGLFSAWKTSIAGGLAAVLCVALFGWLLMGTGSSNGEIVENWVGPVKEEAEINNPEIVKTVSSESEENSNGSDEPSELPEDVSSASVEAESVPVAKPVRVVERKKTIKKAVKRRVPKKNSRKSSTPKKKTPVKPATPAPTIDRLNPLMAESEDTDEGLRLTDLFGDDEVEDER